MKFNTQNNRKENKYSPFYLTGLVLKLLIIEITIAIIIREIRMQDIICCLLNRYSLSQIKTNTVTTKEITLATREVVLLLI